MTVATVTSGTLRMLVWEIEKAENSDSSGDVELKSYKNEGTEQ